jgi:hypothetical protein
VTLSRRPGWTTSAAWTNSNELIVIDQMYNQALRYSPAGESLGTFGEVVEGPLERSFPKTVKVQGTKLVFQLGDHRVRALDRNYALVSEAFLGGYGPDGALPKSSLIKPEIRSLWQWQLAGDGGEAVAFSDIRLPPDQLGGPPLYRVGYVRFPVADPGNFTIIGEAMTYDARSPACPSGCSPGTALRLYNRLGHDYIATLGSSTYILRLDELKIYRQSGSVLDPLPVNFAAVTQPGVEGPPSLPGFYRQADYTDVMARVELSTMPTGLYAWGDWLFVITRTFDGTSIHWTITKIDPASGRILGTAAIPTHANHLTIAPGAQRWAIIEKGPVKGWNDNQEIPSILFIPAERFTDEIKGDICAGQ